MKNISIKLLLLGLISIVELQGQDIVSAETMQSIYNEVNTPYKYGLIMVPGADKKIDSPSVFRLRGKWYMSYVTYVESFGYETYLAESENLLEWRDLGKIMSFEEGRWDMWQRAGYLAIQEIAWGGSYKPQRYKGKYWMSYLGGSDKGYEAGMLGIGIAFTKKDITKVEEWCYLDQAVLSANDQDVGSWENETLFKSTVIWDREKKLGAPFVMYYNAYGATQHKESIGMAISDDLVSWRRYSNKPVLEHPTGITGDAQIQKIGDLYVMFYFGAFWQDRNEKNSAFDRFACSYDLVNWTDWEGEDLIEPSESYDSRYAHKPFVLKYKGVVYHFYCAVDEDGNRGIALATSEDLGKSTLSFEDL